MSKIQEEGGSRKGQVPSGLRVALDAPWRYTGMKRMGSAKGTGCPRYAWREREVCAILSGIGASDFEYEHTAGQPCYHR
jgi:hypothetical protein